MAIDQDTLNANYAATQDAISNAFAAGPAPVQPRGGFAEVGTGLMRGALVGLPELAGKALQYTSSPGNSIYDFGKGLADSAEARGQSPSLTLQPESHGPVVNALAEGAGMVAPGVAVPLALGGAAAAAGASPFLAGGAALAGAGALFGAQAGQTTLEKAEKAGVEPDVAHTAARINAAQTFAAQTALGVIGGKFLGVFGKTMGAMFTKDAAPLAEQTMTALTGLDGAVMPTLKHLPIAAAEALGVNVASEAASGAVEQHYGIDSTSPLDRAKDIIGPTLGMTALLTPMGIVTRAAQARSAQVRTATLANGESAPELRAQLAGEYAAALHQVDPAAAAAFRQNANIAIQSKQHMEVDSNLFTPGAVTYPVQEHFQPAQRPQLGMDPAAGTMVVFPDGTTGYRADVDNWINGLPEDQRLAARARLSGLGEQPTDPNAFTATPAPRLPAPGDNPARPNLFVFPDGTTSHSLADVDKYVDSLPANERTAARAKLLNLGPEPVVPTPIPKDALDLHEQVKQALTDAGVAPAAMPTRKEFAASDAGKGLKGQQLAKAYRSYIESPDTLREMMRKDADSYEAVQAREQERLAAEQDAAGTPRNPAPEDTGVPPDPNAGRTQLADAMNAALKKRDEDAAFAQRDAAKGREQDAIHNIARGEALAQAAERGELQPDPNAPKRPEDLVADWTAAMTENDMDTKAQARVPFEKRLAALGIGDMKTHQEQIDALKTIVADKKTGQGMRDRVSMLVGKLEAEMPAAKPEPIPVETTEAAASKTDTQVAQEPAGTPTGRQAVLDGLVQPDATRAEVLETMHERAQTEAAALVAHPDPVKAEALQTKLDHMAAVETEAKAQDAADLAGTVPPQAEMMGENIVPKPPALEGDAPPQAAAVGENIVPKPPRRKGPMTLSEKRDRRAARQAEKEAEAATKPDNEEAQGDSSMIGVAERADEIADKIAELRADFAQRLRAGEVLSPLEKERYDDLNGAARTIDHYTEGKATPSDGPYVDWVSQFVYEASQPYTKSKLNSTGFDEVLKRYASDVADRINPALLLPAAFSHKVSDVLANLAQRGSEQWVKDLAARLQGLLPETAIYRGDEPAWAAVSPTAGKGVVGEYSYTHNTIAIHEPTEATILHEATHAATVQRLATAELLDAGKDVPGVGKQEAAQLKLAYREIQAIAKEASRLPGANKQYGMSSVAEFIAEVHSNPEFRQFLQGTPTVWARVVDAVRRLLGLPPSEGKLVERAYAATDPFFGVNDRPSTPMNETFRTETTLQRAIMAADADRTPFSKMGDAVFKAVLPWKTVEFIAHQIRGLPEMVASGFSRGVDAHQQANTSHQVASEFLNSAGSKYVAKLDSVLRAIGDPTKAQSLQREMATIGGEASRVGFDYRMNGKDNLAADPSLNAADKSYMDEIHRRFTQLQRLNPEAAALLEAGERLNRSALINKVSTIGANIMDARAGVARRLAAELVRMDPADARRAELASQVQAMTLESTFAARYARTLDFLDPALRTAKNADPVRFYDGAAAVLGQRLEAAFKAADALPAGTPLREHMQALAGIYRAQVKNPYFSLGRDGDYFVKVGFKDVDAAANARIQAALEGTNKVVGDLTRGDSHAYFRVDTADQARALHDKLVAAGQGKVADTAWGLQTARVNEVSGVAPALRSLLDGLEETVAHTPGLKPDQAAIMKASLTQQILSMLPETASRSASMGRRGVPGYDAAFLTSYARRASAAVHETAGLYTNRAYADAAKRRADAIDQLNRTGSTEGRIRAVQVDNEINQRFANSMKPSGSSAAVSMATSLSHSFYLGMSPAFFIRTMAQPWHRGIPLTGSKFGYAQAMSELAGATPTAMKLVANTIHAAVAKDGLRGVLGAPIELKGLDLSPKEQNFINELHLRGVLDLGESKQLMMAAEGAGSRKMQDALRMASVSAQLAEMTNRVVMGLSAFRLAEKRPGLLGKETSTEYAIRTINLAMDNFDPSNTARAIGRHGFAGPLTPLFAQFQNYSLQTMQQIARTVHDGFFGQDKSVEGLQRAREAKREFAGLMATTGMISGALGLPFANAFAGVYNNLMADEDKPEDVRISIRNWAKDTFGPAAAGVLMNGPAHALGVDTGTFGLQGLLPGSDFLASRMLWKDRSETEARSMLGPAVSLGLDLGQAISKMSDGYWLKGIEAALPVGLRSYFKAEELARVGYTDSKGNELPIKAGATDVAWRVLGFQTAEKADQGEAARDFVTNQKLLQHRRGVITDQFIKGVSDPSVLADAGQQLQAFNAKNPTQAIHGADIAGAIRGHLTEQALGLASGIGVAASKRQYPTLINSERFAAMPGR